MKKHCEMCDGTKADCTPCPGLDDNANSQELSGFNVTVEELLSRSQREKLGIDSSSNVQQAFMRICVALDESEQEVARLRSEAIHKATPFTASACLKLEEIIEQKDQEIARLRDELNGHNPYSSDPFKTCVPMTEYLKLRNEVEDLGQKYRYELWLNHGHTMQYGDDGEMQCCECLPFGLVDWKREPLEKLEQTRMLIKAMREGENHA